MATRLADSHRLFFADQALSLIFHARLDLKLHSGPLTQDSTSILHQLHREMLVACNTSCLLIGVRVRCQLYPVVPSSKWHGRFGHLTNYAASYFTYAFCKVAASAIWKQLFSSDSFNAQAGNQWRGRLLPSISVSL